MAHLQRHWSIEHRRTAAVQQDCEQEKISDITAKNFAFICKDGDWHFAPAYDLLPSNGLNGYHTTSINDSIVPSKEDLIAVINVSDLLHIFICFLAGGKEDVSIR